MHNGFQLFTGEKPMRHSIWITAMLVALLYAGAAAADSVSMVLEIEGTLSKSGNQFQLSATGGLWALEFDESSPTDTQVKLAKFLGKKTRVGGCVAVRMQGDQFSVAERMLQLRYYYLGCGAKVGSIATTSPAAGLLKKGDIIIEINRQRINEFDGAIEALAKSGGKSATMVVYRAGKTTTLEIKLGNSERPFGITGETAWRRNEVDPGVNFDY
jgi:opacity protein-like surface antigen